MTQLRRVVVVGPSAAGIAAAESLRPLGLDGLVLATGRRLVR